MAARWSQRELTTLLQNLADGFPVQGMMALISTREKGAIIQQALKRNYRIETSKVDGITRFYHGVTRRRGGGRNAATNDVEVPVAAEALVNHEEPRRIVPNDGLSANMLAVRILTENDIRVDPDIIRYLSIHIIGGQL